MADRKIVGYRIAVAILSVVCLGLLATAVLLLRSRPDTEADIRAVNPDAIMAALNDKLEAIGQKRSDGLEVGDEERLARVFAAIELNSAGVFADDAATKKKAAAHLASILDAMSFSSIEGMVEAFSVPEVMKRAEASPLFALKVNTFYLHQMMMRKQMEVETELERSTELEGEIKRELEKLMDDYMRGDARPCLPNPSDGSDSGEAGEGDASGDE